MEPVGSGLCAPDTSDTTDYSAQVAVCEQNDMQPAERLPTSNYERLLMQQCEQKSCCFLNQLSQSHPTLVPEALEAVACLSPVTDLRPQFANSVTLVSPNRAATQAPALFIRTQWLTTSTALARYLARRARIHCSAHLWTTRQLKPGMRIPPRQACGSPLRI